MDVDGIEPTDEQYNQTGGSRGGGGSRTRNRFPGAGPRRGSHESKAGQDCSAPPADANESPAAGQGE
eukprot:7064050-Prymnesium_polylepis.1